MDTWTQVSITCVFCYSPYMDTWTHTSVHNVCYFFSYKIKNTYGMYRQFTKSFCAVSHIIQNSHTMTKRYQKLPTGLVFCKNDGRTDNTILSRLFYFLIVSWCKIDTEVGSIKLRTLF